MHKLFLLLLLVCCGVQPYAQQSNYLYIEADKGQPFYVKIKDKVYSSSTDGYIIIPSLIDESYVLQIGFPKNVFPEQRFTIPFNRNDKGYQLKNLGEKGWGLFDLQTKTQIMNDTTQAIVDTNQIKKTDAFSTMLSKVVNDPAVLVETKKPVVASLQSPLRETPAKTESKPVKLLEWQTENIYEAMYIDEANDTIRISYPIDKMIVAAPPATPLKENKEADVQSTPQPVPADNKESEKPVVKITNSDCKNFATDQDVDKLRVRILKENDMDNKLSAAKKYLRTKCFTVKQVRALAELFIQDENKYQLFDIAYPFISDTENFYQLENNLQEEYYKNRFRAMIKK